MGKIVLENMEFFGFHGVMSHEKELGNTFVVTLEIEVDTQKAGLTDHLDDTVNYQLIYNTIRKQMEIPSKLLEHLAHRISDKLLNKFPRIQELTLCLSKLNPPLGGKVEKATLIITETRKYK
ncbi:MAG: dihydroneopterin aldolase [Bacteroidales bacterium]|jgi:dihydroneopterin aldolase|nr:dihydroneopterin aldolase [Bacteroidales bacterium]ODT55814.1 MAG: dihydroneopterin aldolase [Paludibacter sp. SCN 50-10]OJX91106.1 MAG: dihydroneopterin aldolase [Paludibacter sp. 47-17]